MCVCLRNREIYKICSDRWIWKIEQFKNKNEHEWDETKMERKIKKNQQRTNSAPLESARLQTVICDLSLEPFAALFVRIQFAHETQFQQFIHWTVFMLEDLMRFMIVLTPFSPLARPLSICLLHCAALYYNLYSVCTMYIALCKTWYKKCRDNENSFHLGQKNTSSGLVLGMKRDEKNEEKSVECRRKMKWI